MLKPEDIQPGKGYNCPFVIKNIPLDEFGRPGGMMSLADLPVKSVGDYYGVGDIVTRDMDSELFEVEDHKLKKKFVVPFKDTTDIREAEIVED